MQKVKAIFMGKRSWGVFYCDSMGLLVGDPINAKVMRTGQELVNYLNRFDYKLLNRDCIIDTLAKQLKN